ncbi:MAG: MBL fold metallo-hydrolase [Clostridia bacterium]|nr:MBL fold metallo-hydrolase [Clostridia bacterium]
MPPQGGGMEIDMYELIRAGECSYFMDAPAKAGIYVRENGEAYLIDSGSDRDAGKKLWRIITEQGWDLKGIINTHSHADHAGGNNFLQGKSGCDVFASEIEREFIEHPILETMGLMGANPPKDLLHKLLYAKPSVTKGLDDEAFPKELKIINLPGHFLNMIGVITPDGTAYIADSVSNPIGLEKYRLTYIYDVAKYLETLDMLDTLEAKRFVPSHAPMTEDLSELTRLNREWVIHNAEDILRFAENGATAEEITKAFFDKYELKISYEQYAIVHSTVLSYITWLKDEGRLRSEFVENRLMYFAE